MKYLFWLCLVVCFASSNQLPDASVDGIEAVLTWSQNRIREAEAAFRIKGDSYFASPGSWADQIVYQIQVDRFNNGNLTNDAYNLPPQQVLYQNTPSPYNIDQYRHGGDIAGITQRLDYLVDLGITTLWITPVFRHNGDYHGYCTADLTQIDPGFGTEDDFKLLVKEAHNRGIYVVLDIVVNHMCDAGRTTAYSKPPNHQLCAEILNQQYWSGTMEGDQSQGDIAFSSTWFPPFNTKYYFNRCGANSGSDTSGQGAATIFGDFVDGMFDYDTRNYDFQAAFTSFHQYWIASADIDGYRMDAAKHITDDFIAYFSTTIRDYARTLGKKNFFVIGEVAADSNWEGERLGLMFTNPNNPNDHGHVPQALTNRLWTIQSVYLSNPVAPYPGLSAIYDFAASGNSRDILKSNKPPSAIADYYNSQDFRTVSAQNDPRLFWTLLEIHDWPRFNHDTPYELSRQLVAMTYLLSAMSTPIAYYGLEQGFNGDCHWDTMNLGNATQQIQSQCASDADTCYRQDMMASGPWRLGSVVSSIDSLNYIGNTVRSVWPDWQTDPYLRRDHSAYNLTRKLIHLRRSCSVLRQGSNAFRWTDTWVGGLLAFSRLTAYNEILTVVKPYGGATQKIDKIAIDGGINSKSGVQYVNVFNTNIVGYTGFENGQAYLYFPNDLIVGSGDMFIFVISSNIQPYDAYLQISLCKQ